jgi:hypothetical protein
LLPDKGCLVQFFLSIRGRDIKRYSYEWARLYLIAAHNGIPEKNISKVEIEKYPAVKGHLDSYWKQIKSRADQGDTPYHLRSCAYMDDFSKQKIVWAELARTGNAFTFDVDGYFVGNTGYILVINDALKTRVSHEYLMAMLNSQTMLFYLDIICNRLDETGWRWLRQHIELLPVPLVSLERQREIRGIAQKELHKTTLVGQQKLNALISEIYGLNCEEANFLSRRFHQG